MKGWDVEALLKSVEKWSERVDLGLLLSWCGSRVLRLPVEDVWVFLLPVELSMWGKWRDMKGLIAGIDVAICMVSNIFLGLN